MTNATDSAFSVSNDREVAYGLTKREYFAARAMQGIVSSKIEAGYDIASSWAVQYADALIDALNKD